MAKVVSLRSLRHEVQANGGGDRAVAWVAKQQLGLITSLQLHVAGLRRGAIAVRVSHGSLHRVHRGVFLAGPPLPVPGALALAALLACGSDAWVSHRSAAALWRLAPTMSDEIDVTVVGRRCRSREGVRVFGVERLAQEDRRTRLGIRATAPARTLIDLAAEERPEEVERAIAEGYAQKLLTEHQLLGALDRAGNRPGVALVRSLLATEARPAFTRSEAERRILRLLRDARLPQPLTNVRVAGFEVDLLWPAQRLIVEVDGYAFHGHRRAFERDRRRDAVLLTAGYRVIRITWRQLREEPFAVVSALALALAAADPSRGRVTD